MTTTEATLARQGGYFMALHSTEDRQAFEQEALGHKDLLYSFGLRMTGNVADADDLVQETYLKAYRFWDRYERGTNIRAWLFRIMKNLFINKYRKDAREPAMVDYCDSTNLSTSMRHPSADPNNLQESVFSNLLDDDITGALSDLPENFRTVVVLCDIEGLSYEEIARFVDCPLGTVRSRLHQARKLLHSQLYDYAKDRGYLVAEGVSA